MRIWGFPGLSGGGFSTYAHHLLYFEDDDRITTEAVNAATGALVWTRGFGSSAATVVGNVVYIGSYSGRYDSVKALNAMTRRTLWRFPTDSGVGNPAVANGIVYAHSAAGTLYALSASSGIELWSFQTSPASPDSSEPVVGPGDVVYLVAPGSVYALSASTGQLLWTHTGASGFGAALANGVLYVSKIEQGGIFELNALSGKRLWAVRG